jgi:peptidoglycan/xylan/chitin deacetylase (PgdA/CDA1 family)
MTWDQLKGLYQININAGSHSINHYNLNTLSPDKLFSEIDGSYDELIKNIGQNNYFFAYPFGLLNAKVKNAVSKSLFKGALCYGSVLSNWAGTDIYELKREKILLTTSSQLFKQLINPNNDRIRGIRAFFGKIVQTRKEKDMV